MVYDYRIQWFGIGAPLTNISSSGRGRFALATGSNNPQFWELILGEPSAGGMVTRFNNGTTDSHFVWQNYGQVLDREIWLRNTFSPSILDFSILEAFDSGRCPNIPPRRRYVSYNWVNFATGSGIAFRQALPANQEREVLIISAPYSGLDFDLYATTFGGVSNTHGLVLSDVFNFVLNRCVFGDVVCEAVWFRNTFAPKRMSIIEVVGCLE